MLLGVEAELMRGLAGVELQRGGRSMAEQVLSEAGLWWGAAARVTGGCGGEDRVQGRAEVRLKGMSGDLGVRARA